MVARLRQKGEPPPEYSNDDNEFTVEVHHGGFFVGQQSNKSYADEQVNWFYHCEVDTWDLNGIPCSHAISCLRHERISLETTLPQCYSSASYAKAYGEVIWPYKDKTEWQKVEATKILPPIYEKKIGRPPKSRRKQPEEVQGINGTKLSKHGIIMHCRYCGDPGHNRATCSLRKAGLQPILRKPVSVEQDNEEEVQEQVVFHYHESSAPTMTQLTMLSQMEGEATNSRQVDQGPLPDSNFIASSQPESRPVPPTTATISLKRKAAPRNLGLASKKTAPRKKREIGKKAPKAKKGAPEKRQQL